MDHIPLLKSASPQHVLVPYLEPNDSTVYFDGQDFFEFPKRVGWDEAVIRETGDFRRSGAVEDPNITAAFLQQWLYFGLLSSFLGVSIQDVRTDFTEPMGEHGMRVCTKNLGKHLNEWRLRLHGLSVEEQESQRQLLENLLGKLFWHVARYICHVGLYSMQSPLKAYPTIELSMISLGASLTQAKLIVFPGSRAIPWMATQYVIDLFKASGWCPSDISFLETRLSGSGMFLASHLKARLKEKDHVKSGCTAERCNAVTLDENDYENPHTNCNGCGQLVIDPENIAEILKNDDTYPILKYNDSNATLELRAWSKTSQYSYVAFSHVWADGLGNPWGNALPICQVQRLQKYTNGMMGNYGEGQAYFWLDTFCVPQDRSRSDMTQYRILALKKLHDVFTNAEKVLVLDSMILNISLGDNFADLLGSIACSSWLRRLWTLQEAVIAKRVFLQLSDGTCDLDVVVSKMEEFTARQELGDPVIHEFFGFVYRITRLRVCAEEERMALLWNALQGRDTSEMQDETICHGSILRLDLTNILRQGQNAADRWEQFLLLLKRIPQDLLFLTGPRHNKDGFKWAPATFLRRTPSQHHTLLSHGPRGEPAATAVPTEKGLELHANGFLLNKSKYMFNPTVEAFWLFDLENGIWFKVTPARSKDDGLPPWSEFVSKLYRIEHPAILENVSPTNDSLRMGVLVELLEESTDETYVCRFLMTIGIQIEQRDRWPTFDGWRALDNQNGYSLTSETRSTVRMQKWIVG